MLVVAALGLMDLVAYDDANVTQFQVFDARTDGREFNFGELLGNFFVAIYKINADGSGNLVPLDKRFLNLDIEQTKVEYKGDTLQLKRTPVSVDEYNAVNFPEKSQ